MANAQDLAEAKIALQRLMTGKQVARIGKGDRSVEYTPAKISELKIYISGLEAQLGVAVGSGRGRPARVC